MRNKIFILLMCLCIVTLTGCSDNPISGEIKEKVFLPASSQIIPTTHVICTGKTVITIITPIVFSYPDRWVIKVAEENTGNLKDIYVTQECFNLVNVGDWFTYNPEYCSYDEPCTKTPVKDMDGKVQQ